MFKEGLFTTAAIILIAVFCTGCKTTRTTTEIKRDTVTLYLDKEKEVKFSTSLENENIYQWAKDSLELVITEYTIKPDSVTPYVSKTIKVTREQRQHAKQGKEVTTQENTKREVEEKLNEEGKARTTSSETKEKNKWYIYLICIIAGAAIGYKIS